jgi:hypothetical protein
MGVVRWEAEEVCSLIYNRKFAKYGGARTDNETRLCCWSVLPSLELFPRDNFIPKILGRRIRHGTQIYKIIVVYSFNGFSIKFMYDLYLIMVS